MNDIPIMTLDGEVIGFEARENVHQLGGPLHPTVLLLTTYRGCIVVVLRPKDKKNAPGKWDLPGGHAEYPAAGAGRSTIGLRDLMFDTALREGREELGIDVRPDAIIGDPDGRDLECTDPNNREWTTLWHAPLPALEQFRPTETLESGRTVLVGWALLSLDDAIDLYSSAPEGFADGATRVLRRLRERPEFRKHVEDRLASSRMAG